MTMRYEASMLLVLLAVPLLSGCLDDGADDLPDLSRAYLGALTLTYSRDFPSFEAMVSMNVTVQKDGSVEIGAGQPALYEGDDEQVIEGSKVRVREAGTVTVTPGSGDAYVKWGNELITLSCSVTISGEQETYAWDEDTMSWISVMKTPFEVTDPIDPPFKFDIADAVMNNAFKTATAPQAFGTVTYEWSLVLTPSLG